MKNPATVVRLLCAVLATLSLPLRAENWIHLPLYLDPGRAGHSFSLIVPTTSGSPTLQHGGLLEGLLEIGSGGDSLTLLQAWIDADQYLTLRDDTTGEWLEFPEYYPYQLAEDLRAATWLIPDPNYDPNYSPPPIPSTRRYFLVGADRAEHRFLAASSYGFSLPLSTGRSVSNGAGGTRFELAADHYGAPNFWMIDLATRERSPSGALNLAVTPWLPFTGSLPAGCIYFFLGADQVGQQFTLHSRPAGGTPHLQAVTAIGLSCHPGSWSIGSMDDDYLYIEDRFGNPLTIAEGTAYFSGVIGLGMEYWLTRESDGATGPVAFMDSPSTFPVLLFDAFGPPPPPPPVRVDVRVPLPAESWMVYYSSNVVSGTYPAGLTVDDTITAYSYDDYGNVNGVLSYATAHVDLPEGSSFSYLYDNNSGQMSYNTDTVDWSNWNPTHLQPPNVSPNNLSLSIFMGREDHHLSILQPDANGNEVAVFSFVPNTPEWTNAGTGWTSFDMTNEYGATTTLSVGGYSSEYLCVFFEGEEQFLHEVVSLTVAYDANKPFRIVDNTAGDAAPANTSILPTWYPAPAQKLLSISSSRWGHDLWLQHPNGEAWPLDQRAAQTQGNLTLTLTGVAWWNSYYWYDSMVPWRDFLPWRLQDRSTGEITEFFGLASPSNFINWIALPTPKNLAGRVTAQNAISLQWEPNGASPDGAFIIEVREGNSATWQQLGGPLPVGTTVGTGQIARFTTPPLVLDRSYSYRVRHTFGSPPRRSAPSNVLHCHIRPHDLDNDGMSNAWEESYGFDPYDNLDGEGDEDEDGLTNAEEYAAGANPWLSDTDVDGLSDSEEIALGTRPDLGDTDNDKLTDAEEKELGTDPTLPDTDGDQVNDGGDAWPLEPLLKLPRAPVPHYAVIERVQGNNYWPACMNNEGDIALWHYVSLGSGESLHWVQYPYFLGALEKDVKPILNGIETDDDPFHDERMLVGIADDGAVFGTWRRRPRGEPEYKKNFRWKTSYSSIVYIGDGFTVPPHFVPDLDTITSIGAGTNFTMTFISSGGNAYGNGSTWAGRYYPWRHATVSAPAKNGWSMVEYAHPTIVPADTFMHWPPAGTSADYDPESYMEWIGGLGLANDHGDIIYGYQGFQRQGTAPLMISQAAGNYFRVAGQNSQHFNESLEDSVALNDHLHVLYKKSLAVPDEAHTWHPVTTPRRSKAKPYPNLEWRDFNNDLHAIGTRVANGTNPPRDFVVLINDHDYSLSDLIPPEWELRDVLSINEHGMILASARRVVDAARNPIPEGLRVHSIVQLLPMEFVAIDDDGNPTDDPMELKPSLPSPKVDIDLLEISNVTLRDDGTYRGSVRIEGTIRSDLCDTLPGAEGKITEAKLFVNGKGDPVETIPVDAEKQVGSILGKPFPYHGQFAHTIHNVEVTEGKNTFTLTARDEIYQIPGYDTWTVRLIENSGGTAGPPPLTTSVQIPPETENAAGLDQLPVTLTNSSTSLDVLLDRKPDGVTYSDPAGTVTLRLVGDTRIDPVRRTVLAAEVTAPSLGLDHQTFHLWRQVSGTGPFAGAVVLAPTDAEPPPDDPPAPAASLSMSERYPIDQSTGREFHPFALRFRGPEVLVSRMQVALGAVTGPLRPGPDGRYYMRRPGSDAALIMTHRQVLGLPAGFGEAAALQALNGVRTAATDYLEFRIGFVHGLGVGGWEMISGLAQLGWGAATYVGRDVLITGLDMTVALQSATGTTPVWAERLRYVFMADQQAIHDNVMAFLMPLIQLSVELKKTEYDIIASYLTGDSQEGFAKICKLSDMHLSMLNMAAELLWNQFKVYEGASARKRGYMQGRLMFEIGSFLIPMTKFGHLPKLTKLEFLKALKTRPFFQSGSGSAAFAKIEEATTEIPSLMSRLEKVAAGCFVAGTPVWTKESWKPVETIRPGDLVLARDEATREQGWKPVLATTVSHPAALAHVRYSALSRNSGEGEGANDDCSDDELVCTVEHPFWVADGSEGRFVAAQELVPGARLSLADGGEAAVREVWIEAAPPGVSFTTHNFEVAGAHTYFAGHAGVWVHNPNCVADDVADAIPTVETFESFIHNVERTRGLSARDRTLEGFEILVGAGKKLNKPASGLELSATARFKSWQFVEEFADLLAAEIDDVDKLREILAKFPTVNRWNKDFFRGAVSAEKVATEIHHIIPEKILRKLRELDPRFDQIPLGELPGHAWREQAHRDYHNIAQTGMNPALLNNQARMDGFQNPKQVMEALIEYYQNNEQPSMAKIVRAWSKVHDIPVD